MSGIQITFDANDPHMLGRWWADMLGYEIELDDGHDEFIQGLLDKGAVGPDDVITIDGHLWFADGFAAKGDGPRLYFQRVPEQKSGKNRMHLDIAKKGDDLEAEVAALVAKGATELGRGNQGAHHWAVMADPEGNEFCIH